MAELLSQKKKTATKLTLYSSTSIFHVLLHLRKTYQAQLNVIVLEEGYVGSFSETTAKCSCYWTNLFSV